MKNIEKPQPQATEVGGRASVVFYQKPQQIVGYSIAEKILLSIADGLRVVRNHHWNGWHVLDLRTGKIGMYVWSRVVTAKWAECWWEAWVWENALWIVKWSWQAWYELPNAQNAASHSDSCILPASIGCESVACQFTSHKFDTCSELNHIDVCIGFDIDPYNCTRLMNATKHILLGKCAYIFLSPSSPIWPSQVSEAHPYCPLYHNRGKQHHIITSSYPTSNSIPSNHFLIKRCTEMSSLSENFHPFAP